jgi:hypothetical protein
MKYLIFLLLLLSSAAFGQDTVIVWSDPMKLPVKSGSLTIIASKDQLIAYELQAGKTYSFTEVDTPPVSFNALSYATMNGITRGTDFIGSCDTGDFVSYTIQLVGRTKVKIEYARDWNAPIQGQGEIHAGSATGPVIGTFVTPNTGGWGTYSTVETTIGESSALAMTIVFKTTGVGNIKTITVQ